MAKFIKVGNFKPTYYKDFQVMAHENLHVDMFNVFEKYSANYSGKVLDAASGQGAFSARLKDANYDVECADIDKDGFKLKNTPFYHLDFNDLKAMNDFAESNKKKFGRITSLETVEHIENPWLLLRTFKKLLADDGYLILSTPNTESIFSRISFLFNAKFHQFYEADLSYGHVNPQTSHHLKVACEMEGLEVVEIIPVGTYPLIHLRGRLLFSIGWSLGNLLLYPFVKGYKTGWALCYIIRKKKS